MAAGDHTVTGTMTANKIAVADSVVVANLNADQFDGAEKSFDGTLVGNSDAAVPTERAIKTYVDTAGALKANDNAVVKLTGNQTVAGVKTFSSRIIGAFPLLHIRDEQANNTQGGDFTAGAWRKRTLNTVKTNEISGASLASSQITLPAGTYEILARAPAFSVNAHKAKLRNTTDSSDTIIGSNAHASGTYGGHTDGWIRGRFTIAGTKVFELQHYAGTTRETNGFGITSNFSVIEVYAEVWIKQVS